jgi:hypothetical protein
MVLVAAASKHLPFPTSLSKSHTIYTFDWRVPIDSTTLIFTRKGEEYLLKERCDCDFVLFLTSKSFRFFTSSIFDKTNVKL